MRKTLDELLNEALPLWGDVAGLIAQDGPVKRYTSSSWEAEKHAKDLSDSRLDDPTGRTTLLLLRGLASHYLQGSRLSVWDLVKNYDAMAPVIERGRTLLGLLESEVAEAEVALARQEVALACDHYALQPERREKVLALDDYALGLLAYHASRSMRRLNRHDFAQAEPTGERPGYNCQVYEFWNVASIVCALAEQRVSGVTLVLFRDPEGAFRSYFALAVRHGGTITLFTDRPDYPHPDFASMTRRPDRDLERRREQHWFPYDLLNLKEREDPAHPGQTRLYEGPKTQIARVNPVGVPVREVRDLQPEQFLWLVHVFRHIVDNCLAGERAPSVSYTANMIRDPRELLDRSVALQAPGAYEPLALAPLTRADLTPEALASQWEQPPTGFNRWMVDRYGAEVPEDLLNVVSAGEADRLLPALEEKGLLRKVQQSHFAPLTNPIRTLNSNDFGTAQDLDRDRRWCARLNQCRVVQRLAVEEFKREKDATLDWYKQAVSRNREVIIQGVAEGTLMLPSVRFECFSDDPQRAERNAVQVKAGKGYSDAFPMSYGFSGEVKLSTWHRSGSRYLCVDRQVDASVFGVVSPTCPEALAVLCGVKVGDLPWALQHWYKGTPGHGNSILDRIDPEDWALDNPWLKLDLRVMVALSRTAYKERRKRAGLPPEGVLATPRKD